MLLLEMRETNSIRKQRGGCQLFPSFSGSALPSCTTNTSYSNAHPVDGLQHKCILKLFAF